MRIYLAAPWKRREEARQVREQLKALGIQVTGRWLDVDETHTTQRQEALNDVEDITLNSQALLVLNLESSEGKAFEQGLAYMYGMPVVVVGDRSNVFQYLPDITVVPTLEDAVTYLQSLHL